MRLHLARLLGSFLLLSYNTAGKVGLAKQVGLTVKFGVMKLVVCAE